MRRIIDFLEYDEVTLFCLNYSYLLVFLLEPGLFLDLIELLTLSPLLVVLPLTLVYLITVLYGLYYSFKHVWSDTVKSSRELFFMAGGGALLALSAAGFALYSLSGSPFLEKIPALYGILYNLLILWFMGLLKGLDVGELFISKREAQRPEALAAFAVVSVLGAVLKLYYELPWWQTINYCVFYSLSANKIVLFVMHQLHERRRRAEPP